MNIDTELIRGYLEEINIKPDIDEDGDLMIVQGADDDFPHNVCIFMIVRNNYIRYQAGAPGYELPADADPLALANRHNCRRMMPTAVVREGKIRMEYSFLLDEEVSKEYIIENCIKMPLGHIWRAFVEFERPDEE